MAEYTLTIPTLVPAGGTIPYNNTIIGGCCNIKHRAGSGLVRVKGGSCCKPNVYHVQFHGNVTGFTGDATLGIYLDGELLPETLMSLVSGSAAYVQSVGAVTEIPVDGCCANISARVITGTDVEMTTANIIVHKEVV